MPYAYLDYKLVDWTIKTIDAFFIHDVTPKVGSIVYCNLALVAEHTGIYVGDNKIIHLNGSGLVEMVSAEIFCDRLHGRNKFLIVFSLSIRYRVPVVIQRTPLLDLFHIFHDDNIRQNVLCVLINRPWKNPQTIISRLSAFCF